MKSVFPEIKQTAGLATMSYAEHKTLVSFHKGTGKDHAFYEKVYLADPSFFSIFTYDFIRVMPLLHYPDQGPSCFLKRWQKKLVGTADALNKVILVRSVLMGIMSTLEPVFSGLWQTISY